MAKASYSGALTPRNGDCNPPAASPIPNPDTPAEARSVRGAEARPRSVLLAAAGRADVVRLADLVAAIPDHPQPLCAVMALVDAGLLGMDFQEGFGPDLRVWRLSALA